MENTAFELVDNALQAEVFVRLRAEVGFAEKPLEQARRALENGLFNVSALSDGTVVGMGRLVGDGAMYWYLQDILVQPDYQGKGIGKSIVNRLLDYVRHTAIPGTRVTVGLTAAKGKESFYERLGFVQKPTETSGAGMERWLEIDN